MTTIRRKAIAEFLEKERRERAFLELKKTADYKGNWSELFRERLLHPDTVRKYVQTQLLDTSVSESDPRFIHLADEYRSTIGSVFDHTNIGHSSEYGYLPHQAGIGTFLHPATVFTDAAKKEGVPLTPEQKSIVEAHEQAHGVLQRMHKEQIDILASIADPAYIEFMLSQNPDRLALAGEIVARMTQMKNYFGMKGGEEFTDHHLEYAKEHYLRDTDLDNSIGFLMRSIKPERKDLFVRLMNVIPC